MSRTNPRVTTTTEHYRLRAVGGPADGGGPAEGGGLVSARTRRRISQVILYGLLIIGALIALLPMLWMLSASFMPTGEASTYPPHLIPSRVKFTHYRELFTRLNLGRYLFNRTLIAVTVTAISLVVNSMAGYAFAKLRFRGRDRTFRLLSLGLVLPVQVAMLPLFLLMKNLHLINTYWGVIIPGMASIFGIFLIRQYALSIPDDMLDAARIESAGAYTNSYHRAGQSGYSRASTGGQYYSTGPVRFSDAVEDHAGGGSRDLRASGSERRPR